MSETDRQRERSPLESERGSTRIDEKVVAQITGMAAREVEGVHMGGSTSRTAGGLLGNITGSEGQTRGVSVEVGRTETAIDLTLGIDYGKNIIETVEEVRRRISERVGQMTGLRITELNATVSDIVFPDGEAGDGSASGTRAAPEAERRPSLEDPDVSPVSPRSRTYTEAASGPVPEEEVRVEEEPVAEDETAELRPGEGVETRRRATGEGETRQTETRRVAEEGTTEEGETRSERDETMGEWRTSRERRDPRRDRGTE